MLPYNNKQITCCYERYSTNACFANNNFKKLLNIQKTFFVSLAYTYAIGKQRTTKTI